MLKRYLFFLLFCCFFLLSSAGQEGFSFVFISDIHYNDSSRASEAMDRAVDTINALNPSLILVGGDMVYDVLRSDQHEAEQLFRAYCAKISGFEAPVKHAIGNHEHFALYNKQIDPSHLLFGKKMYEKYFGACNYSFDYKGWHFVILDNMVVTPDRKYIGRVDSARLAWLENDLKLVNDSTPIALMAHVPLVTTLSQWYGGGTKANTNRLAIENTDEVLKLFARKNLRLILQGHIHYFEVLNVLDKTTVISAPAFSGKWWNGKLNGMEKAFLLIHVTGKGDVEYRLIQLE